MDTGTVKFFDESKGFGFIEREGQEDLYINRSSFDRSVTYGDTRDLIHSPGQAVTFEVGTCERGQHKGDPIGQNVKATA